MGSFRKKKVDEQPCSLTLPARHSPPVGNLPSARKYWHLASLPLAYPSVVPCAQVLESGIDGGNYQR